MLTACDIDRDGKISYDEFCRFCTATEKELWQLFQSIDQDRSGRLDKGELSSAFERAGVTVSKTRLDRFFSYIDKDRDGTIDFGEWRGRHSTAQEPLELCTPRSEDDMLIQLCFQTSFSSFRPTNPASLLSCHTTKIPPN